MPKIKTDKAIAKRIKKTSTGKLLKRHDGQDHFNARQSGKKKRNKRSDNTLSTFTKTINRATPYT